MPLPAGLAFGFLRRLSFEVVGDQVGVFPEPVGMAFDLDHDGVVQQAVQQGRGDDVVAEDGSPVLEAAIGGEHGGALLVTGIDQLEEQVGPAGFDEVGLKPLRPPQDVDFHDLVTECYERAVITSNLDFGEWGGAFPNQLLGAATLDRLRHNAYRVVLDGNSYRSPRPMDKQLDNQNEKEK